MPGMLGLIGRSDPVRFSAALGKLVLFPSYGTRRFDFAPDVVLGIVFRTRANTETWSYAAAGGVAVLLYGTVFDERPRPHQVTASEILVSARVSRFEQFVEGLDGSFVIALVDMGRHTATIVNDRIASQPIYYSDTGAAFAFGPEAKAVMTATGTAPRYSTPGLIDFLAAGYNLADSTLFEGIAYLQPATVLTHDLRTGKTTQRRYWSMDFVADPAYAKRSAAEDALFNSVVRAHRLLLCDHPDHQLFLSGGLDSRGILGVLQRIGAPPRQTLGWGLRQDIPYSDAHTAGLLAQLFHVPYRFLSYDTGAFIVNASQWAYQTELANDNIGWYAEGVGALQGFYSAEPGVSFIGDEAWGWGGRAFNEVVSRAFTLPPRLPSALTRILRYGVVQDGESVYDEHIRKVTAPCSAVDWTDRKDFLYLHGRVARFIMSLGYYKEYATELRRPYLTKGVLDVVRKLPGEFRVFKNLYCTMVLRHLPETMAFPNAIVSSLPDWAHDLAHHDRLRDFFLELLDYSELELGSLGRLIDRSRFESMRDRFFAEPAHPEAPRCGSSEALMYSLINRSRWLTAALPRVKSLLGRGSPVDSTREFDVLRRVALLVLLQRRFADLANSP